MLKSILCCILFILSTVVQADLVRIAVIDTGLDTRDIRFSNILCKDGHKDFSGYGLKDYYGHGTHVAGLIRRQLKGKEKKYCLIILKYFHNKSNHSDYAFYKAIEYAAELKVQFVNISSSGFDEENREYFAFLKAKETKWIVSAGNDSQDLDISCNVYPACYNLPNVISVGNMEKNLAHSETSNYGSRVKAWEVGTSVLSDYIPNDECDFNCERLMSGTSMSAAIHTGKLVRKYIQQLEGKE
jgi:subtilisin family serine protease